MAKSIAFIITTYNRPDTLNLLLESVVVQRQLPDEIIVADDGSDDKTRQICATWSSILNIKHCWQPDNGFRAARARNLALLKSTHDLCVLIDGDCIIPRDFIQQHLRMLNDTKKIVAGGRHLLSKKKSKNVLREGKQSFASIFKHFKFMSVKLGGLRDLRPHFWQSARTCNLSFQRDLALTIKGFDESFKGWGLEDSDFVIRALNEGYQIRSARLGACVAHLWHKEQPKAKLVSEISKLHRLVESGLTRPAKSVLMEI